jgi:hypothetical protein
MSVFVDDVRHRFGRMVMCHCWADTLPELLEMMDRIGVQRKWLQQPPKASWVHFDISLGKKVLAIAEGAILTDKYGPVEFEARRQLASDNPRIREIGQRRLDQIITCRTMFGYPLDGRIKP